MDWITQIRERVPVVLTNMLHVPGIITNLISVQKLDLKGIYWRSDDQKLHVLKTHKEVGVSRVVGDLYIVITDLQKDALVFGTHVASAAIAVLQSIKFNVTLSSWPSEFGRYSQTYTYSNGERNSQSTHARCM